MRSSLLCIVGAVLLSCSGRSLTTPDSAGSAGDPQGGAAGTGSDRPNPPLGQGGAPTQEPIGGASAGAPEGPAPDPGPFDVAGVEEVPTSGASTVLLDGTCVLFVTAVPEAPFASPASVWSRVSRLVFDEDTEPLSPLPAETTRAWAGTAALEALREAERRPGGAPGLRRLLRAWLDVDRSAIFEQDWPALLAEPVDAPQTLLTTPLLEAGRVGVFSEVAFLTSHSTITQRGIAMLDAIGGYPVPPQPDGTPPLLLGLGQTRRAALTALVAGAADCNDCHQLVDPLGFSLEHFDALGRYRDTEAGVPVDSSGQLYGFVEGFSGVVFSSIADLGPQLAPLCTTAYGFARAGYSDALAAAEITLPPSEPEKSAPFEDRLLLEFMFGGRSYQALVKGIAQSSAFLK